MTETASETPRVAIAAIVKNEAPYLLEWIAFHRVVGVTQFFIADNDSDDGATELLAALQAIGIVSHIRFPGVAGRASQLPAYAEIMARNASAADWIAFIDADEFLVPTDISRSLALLLEGMGRDVGAVVANWAVYGSSSRDRPGEGLVIERFTRRAEEGLTTNCHYKSILRTAAYKGVHANPHLFRIRSGYRSVHADGSPVFHHAGHGPGLSSEVHWRPFRINHYVVKSRAEFERKKAPRGRANDPFLKREAKFFVQHDRNEVEDVMAPDLVAATKAEMDALREALRAAGHGDAIVMLDDTISTLRPVYQPPRGVIDRIAIRDGAVTVNGWALDGEDRSMEQLGLAVGGFNMENLSVKRLPRRDVVRHFPGADPEAGYQISFLISDLPQDMQSAATLELTLHAGADLKLSKTFNMSEAG